MLMMSEETRTLRDQHLDYFLKYSETAQPELRGRRQAEWMSMLETEHDNLRAALEWSPNTRPELGLRIAVALIDFWDTRGHITEARHWLDVMLQKTTRLEPGPTRVDGMLGAVGFAVRQTDLDISKKLLQESITLARAINYQAGIARGLTSRGLLMEYFDGDLDNAESLHKEALDIYRKIGDKLSIGQALGPLASSALKRYDFSRAESLYQESLSLFREVENEREIAGALENLAEVALDRRMYTRAESFAKESLSLYRKLEDKHGIATALRALGVALHNEGDCDQARSTCEQSAELFGDLGDRGCLILTMAALARQLQHQGELQEAFDTIQEARKILDSVEKELIATSVFDVFGRIALAMEKTVEAQRQFLDGLIFQKEGRDAHFVPSLLEGLAGIVQPKDAVRLLGAAASLRKKVNLPLMQVEQMEYEKTIGILKTELTDADFQCLWEEGSTMTVEEAVSFALEKGGL
jgi:tetratricopeptide (TPR) repeat protein